MVNMSIFLFLDFISPLKHIEEEEEKERDEEYNVTIFSSSKHSFKRKAGQHW